MFTMWSFNNTKKEHCLYREEDVINSEKKKMLLLTKKEVKLHQDSPVCYIWRKTIYTKAC